jgi:hypothetical protein
VSLGSVFTAEKVVTFVLVLVITAVTADSKAPRAAAAGRRSRIGRRVAWRGTGRRAVDRLDCHWPNLTLRP